MARAIARRLSALESAVGAAEIVLAIRWPGDDFVSIRGRPMPLAEYRRLYPDAKEIQLTWGDDDAQGDGNTTD